jgi:hypothetical protein
MNQNHILSQNYCEVVNKFYTKTFGIVHILIVYLLIMLLSVIFIFQLKISTGARIQDPIWPMSWYRHIDTTDNDYYYTSLTSHWLKLNHMT